MFLGFIGGTVGGAIGAGVCEQTDSGIAADA